MLTLHDIRSPDLVPPELPADPAHCRVPLVLTIGPADEAGSDVFHVEVVTPAWLADHPGPRWGAGLLIVPSFSWDAVARAVAQLVASTPFPSWEHAAASLSRTMCRESADDQAPPADVR